MVAIQIRATAFVTKGSGRGNSRRGPTSSFSSNSACARTALLALALTAALLAQAPASAASNKVRITNLADVAFGTIANLGVDAVQSQSICVYADTNTNGYNVTAIGTGPAGAFQLSSGTANISYDVLWNSSAGRNSGTQVAPNVPLTGQVSTATQQSCSSGPASSASLVVVLRSSALSSASAGTYSGGLTLVIGPE